MKETPFAVQLPCEGLGEPFYYYPMLPSTNDTAAVLAQDGARHGTLVFADEQTAGRGREQRRWMTPAGTALAFSVILRPQGCSGGETLPYAGLGAVAVADALAELGVDAAIKWPNDVLVGNRKLCGVLAEISWTGEKPDAVILGIGVNVLSGAVPPAESIRIPATCVEWERGSISRADVFHRIVCALGRRLRAGEESWIQAWEQKLAFLDREVVLESASGATRGVVRGLDAQGRLQLERGSGIEPIHVGEMRMRLVDRREE